MPKLGASANVGSRKSASFSRIEGTRQRLPRVLIVSEGSETEPTYFEAARDDLGIANRLVVCKGSGSNKNRTSPSQVFEFAKVLAQDELDTFDHVFVVFDKDSHPPFGTTIRAIQEYSKSNPAFKAITSTPCIELWFLVHFEYSTAPFARTSNASLCDQVKKRLKKIKGFKNYNKSNLVYATLKAHEETAKKNAQLLRTEQQSTYGEAAQLDAMPWTNVDVILELLKSMSKESRTKP